ncbi:MAG: HEAT repeat domain-containing protein [Treponema sp.]|jgi:hypothetical protein|nr:HEAT repeat domain-containing protein [Treponema sp.]
MTSWKRFFVLLFVALFAVGVASGQSGNSRSPGNNDEKSVEESYLQEAIELMIIRETSKSESLDQKMLALQFIGDAIERGNTNDEIRQTLEFISMEGLTIQARENGRLVNNYPMARREAARYLGQLGTVEARDALIKLCNSESEPMVLQEAIKSLGDIGNNEGDRAVRAIVWIVRYFDIHNPDNMLALSAVDAIAKLAKSSNGIREPEAYQLLIRISEGTYITAVKNKARQLLSDLRTSAATRGQ